MTLLLKNAILVIGADVPSYVTEVHSLKKVYLTIDMTVALVTKSTAENTPIVHNEGENADVCEVTSSGLS